jgi:hypothetical protein
VKSASALGAIFALPLLSCSESPTEPRQREPVAFATVYVSPFSGVETRRGELITDSGRWSAVWNEIHRRSSPLPPLPSVDFGSEMVLFAALGTEPDACWSTGIEVVEAAGERSLEVSVAETRAPPSCACLAVVVNPVHAVRLQRLDRRASFRFDRRVLSGTCR